MKVGDIVRYRIFPHEELHFSGMTGIVLSKPQVKKDQFGDMVTIDVMWSEERKQSFHGECITWEYIDEIEVIK